MKGISILVYACNWCSYAGADLAGVSRLQYPPSAKILRIMCTGRLSEALLLHPFTKGVNGVLVCGCHIGNCHYVGGNKRAMEVVEKTKRILSILGIEEERLQFHEISASEGALFAKTISSFTERMKEIGPIPFLEDEEGHPSFTLEEVVRRSKAYLCYNCGGCTASCPLAGERKEFNLRKRVRRLLYEREDAGDFEIHTCLLCALCQSRCPKGVDIIEFVKGVRFLSRQAPMNAHDGVVEEFFILQAKIKKSPKKMIEWGYFPGCLGFFDILFPKRVEKIKESVLSLLRKIGVKADSLEGYCCGHDLLFGGRIEDFFNLAKRSLSYIKESGVRKLIVSCPECFYMFSIEYPRLFSSLPFEIHYIGELLLEKGHIPSGNGKTITLQDSCRLTRFLAMEDVPRRLLQKTTLIEMEPYGIDALCCGGSGWRNCFSCNKEIQVKRLKEAKDSGASTLITLCPKCKIHLECAKDDLIEIKDLFVYLNECL